ncbi:MAG: PEP-CTERM sorting domain-containing protein [Opitutaceae bacterium]|nr:PEP-CTERM sorting domain-containing protein [Opitutaceae bacterium]
MKYQYHLFVLTCFLGIATVQLQAEVTITPASLPDLGSFAAGSITLKQDSADSNIQVRNKSAADIRSATQSFTWNTSNALAGIALKLHSTQTITTAQDYELRIFKTAGILSGSAVTETLETCKFSITPDLAIAGNYLYLNIPDTLSLANGGTYVFQLAATSIVSTNVLYLARTTNNSFPDGGAKQLSTNANPTTAGNDGWDYTFALVAATAPVPEPATAGLMLAGGALALGALLRRRLS